MKTRKLYLTISSLFLAACNSGSGDVGKNSNTDQNTLLYQSHYKSQYCIILAYNK